MKNCRRVLNSLLRDFDFSLQDQSAIQPLRIGKRHPFYSAVIILRFGFTWGVAGTSFCQIFELLFFPLRRVVKFWEAEAGDGFAFAEEKLLHQPFFECLERVEFLAVGGNQLVERSQAAGDSLLFGDAWYWEFNSEEMFLAYVQQSVAASAARDVPLKLETMKIPLEECLEERV